MVGEIKRDKVPAYTFAATNVGVASSDSPYRFSLQKSGNATLSLTGLTTGTYRTYRGFLQIDDSGFSADCGAGVLLGIGWFCNLDITFTPEISGAVSGAVVLSDDSLNAAGSQQIIPLVGIGK